MNKQPTTRLYAVFGEASEVRLALVRLATNNADTNNLEIRSMIPLGEDVVPADTELRSKVPLLAILGGVLGGALVDWGSSFRAPGTENSENPCL